MKLMVRLCQCNATASEQVISFNATNQHFSMQIIAAVHLLILMNKNRHILQIGLMFHFLL